MKLYISGKITDSDPEKVKANLALFNEEEKKLRSTYGCKIINPASLEGECDTWEDYLARDILIIVREQPDIWLLPRWKESTGARLEVAVAKRMKLKIHNEH